MSGHYQFCPTLDTLDECWYGGLISPSFAISWVWPYETTINLLVALHGYIILVDNTVVCTDMECYQYCDY